MNLWKIQRVDRQARSSGFLWHLLSDTTGAWQIHWCLNRPLALGDLCCLSERSQQVNGFTRDWFRSYPFKCCSRFLSGSGALTYRSKRTRGSSTHTYECKVTINQLFTCVIFSHQYEAIETGNLQFSTSLISTPPGFRYQFNRCSLKTRETRWIGAAVSVHWGRLIWIRTKSYRNSVGTRDVIFYAGQGNTPFQEWAAATTKLWSKYRPDSGTSMMHYL